MAIKKIEKIDKYADFKYEISPAELEEAKWLIEQGDFKDLDDFISFSRKMEIKIMEFEAAEKERKAKIRKARRLANKDKNKAA